MDDEQHLRAVRRLSPLQQKMHERIKKNPGYVPESWQTKIRRALQGLKRKKLIRWSEGDGGWVVPESWHPEPTPGVKGYDHGNGANWAVFC